MDTINFTVNERLALLKQLLDNMLTIQADVLVQSELSGHKNLENAADALAVKLYAMIDMVEGYTSADVLM